MGVLVAQLVQWAGASAVFWRKTSWLKALCLGLDVVIVAYLAMVFGFQWMPYGPSHGVGFYAWFFAVAVLATAIVWGVIAALQKKRGRRQDEAATAQTEAAGEKARRRGGGIASALGWAILGALVVGFAGLMFFLPRWFHAFFGDLSADQLVFLLTSGNGESTAETDASVNNGMIYPVVATLLIGVQLPVWFAGWRKRLAAVGASVVLAVASTCYAFTVLPLADLSTMNSSSEFLAENYVNPRDSVSFPEKKRNLLHIYMESVENSYYDRAHGGYDDRNYMPDLLKLNEQGVYFSNTDTMGGPHQTFGSVHSVAAMINMEAGVPMKTSIAGGTAEAMYYPKFPTLGELLHEQGYNTELMMGADSSWGGLGDYYREHGDFLVFDHPYAIENGYLEPGYKEWWGYEDDKIYEFAKQELTRLAAEDNPFYFILENADTHFPDGYKSANMKEEPFDTQYGNVIFYSQREVAKFVRWVQEQPWGPDTTIVIVGDHRSMDKHFFEGWDRDYERTIVNMILNPAIPEPSRERMHNRSYAPFDLFPTTLAALGAELKDERAGLGTNLFSEKQTLIEQHGLETVDSALAKRSEFYFDFR